MPLLVGLVVGLAGPRIISGIVTGDPEGGLVNKSLLTLGLVAVGGFVALRLAKII